MEICKLNFGNQNFWICQQFPKFYFLKLKLFKFSLLRRSPYKHYFKIEIFSLLRANVVGLQWKRYATAKKSRSWVGPLEGVYWWHGPVTGWPTTTGGQARAPNPKTTNLESTKTKLSCLAWLRLKKYAQCLYDFCDSKLRQHHKIETPEGPCVYKGFPTNNLKTE